MHSLLAKRKWPDRQGSFEGTLSQAELAARMGTSQFTIARLESGQNIAKHKDAFALR
jgi:hypothetical protein